MMLKVIAVAMCTLIIVQILKKEKQDIALLIAIFASVLIMMYSFTSLSKVITLIYDLIEKTSIDKRYLQIIVKITGIAYITSFACDICQDADSKLLASKVEFAGKVTIISLSMPIITALIQTILEII